jgi:hypothetical protein
MTKEEYKNKLSSYRQQKQKLINDTYLWGDISHTIFGGYF